MHTVYTNTILKSNWVQAEESSHKINNIFIGFESGSPPGPRQLLFLAGDTKSK